MASNRVINVRVPDNEADLLAAYAAETGRTQTDIIRAFIRSLEVRPRANVAKRGAVKKAG
jgi:Ribbon-helix-helix protein, copG family